MENKDYIKKWLNHSLSDEEKADFMQSEDYKSLLKLDEALLQFKAPEFNAEEERKKIILAREKPARVIQMPWLKPILRVAAIVIFTLLGYYFLLYNPETTFNTGIAETIEISLPDESEVILNAESSVSYLAKTWKKKRQVILKGQAYFSVAKGSKFTVQTNQGNVEVLGTQFSVNIRDQYFEVICYEGSVAVEYQEEIITLFPQDMFRAMGSGEYSHKSVDDLSPSWLMNESSFISTPVKYVLEELERQYDVSISTTEVDKEQLFTGRFTHNNIDLALQSICIPLSLRYELKDNNRISITVDNQR